MKKILVWCGLMLIIPLWSNAQQFQGGLVGGVVGSQVAGDRYSGYNKVGIMGGAYIALTMAEKYTLQLEMEYIQKGSRHNVDPDKPGDITYKLNLGYIEMPLLFRYKIMERVDVEAGLGMGFLVSHKESQDGQDISKQMPGFNATNLSVIAGFSYSFHDRYRINLRTGNSLEGIRKPPAFPGNVQRIGSKWGQYHDILVISLLYRL